MKIPKSETIVLRVSGASLLSVKVEMCKDAAIWTIPKSLYHCRPGNFLGQNQYRISNSWIKHQREFYLLFHFANVTYKSNEKNYMFNFSINLNYNKKSAHTLLQK